MYLDQDGQLQLNREIVAFIGPEGVGKSTIGKKLALQTNKPFVSSGDIVRDLAANSDTDLGDKCRSVMAGYGYLDGDTVLEIFTLRLADESLKEGFILDGALRRLEEIAGLPEVFRRTNREMPVTVVHLRMPGYLSIEKLVTGPKARKRSDDTIDGVMGRLASYYDQLGQRASLIRQQEGWKFLSVTTLGEFEDNYNKVVNMLTSNISQPQH
jgi:adenylate kinase